MQNATVSQSSVWSSIICFLFILMATVSQIVAIASAHILLQASIFMLAFSTITILLFLLYFIRTKNNLLFGFRFTYLISTFTMLISWRIAALNNLIYADIFFLLAFICKAINYISLSYHNLQSNRGSYHRYSHWQILFIRMLTGFTFVPHFTEKLFAGPHFRLEAVQEFANLGLPHPVFFVFSAGLLELGFCFAIGCGFLTRLSAAGAFIYLVLTTILGNLFTLGFIWEPPGGGWEYPSLWGLLIASFVFFGAGRFSLDSLLRKQFPNMPTVLKVLMK